MGEFHNSSEGILYVSIYVKFKNRQKKSLWTLARIVVILGRNDYEGGEGNLYKAGNILYLDLGGG